MADTEVKRHPLVEDYLARLEAAAGKLPRGERKELLADTESYLDQAIKPDATAIEVRGMLGALGTPEALVAQERPKKHQAGPGADGGLGDHPGGGRRAVYWGRLVLRAVSAVALAGVQRR